MDPTQIIRLSSDTLGQCVTIFNTLTGYSCLYTPIFNGTNCADCETI